MKAIPFAQVGVIFGSPPHGADEYISRLLNSALQERHLDQPWRYDRLFISTNPFFEVDFAPELRSRKPWPKDYCFKSARLNQEPGTQQLAVHTDLADLARGYQTDINELHSLMRFPPARAVIRTLLIELESPLAQQDAPLDEASIIRQVDETISTTTQSQRQTFLTQTTAAGPNFADRSLTLCLLKLYAHFESWGCWTFGGNNSQTTVQVLTAIVGLFCNAWAHAPMIDPEWDRFSKPTCSQCLSSSTLSLPDLAVPRATSTILTPEIWFEWSQMYDPWLRRTDSMQLAPTSQLAAYTLHLPVYIAEVSPPEAEKEGRVVVKYLSKPDEERWSFKAILDSRYAGKRSRTGLQYLVEWEYAEPSWQPAKDLQGCDAWVLQFHRDRPGKPGPVAKLRRFL